MRHPSAKPQRLNRILDALASRIGIISAVGFLVGICIATTVYNYAAVTQLERDHAVFRDAQLRNGYVAMSDINRLVLVAQEAALEGTMTPERASDFLYSADILWVRTDNFDMVRDRGVRFESGDASISSLETILAIADAAIAEGFPDPQALARDLIAAAEATRQHLVLFLDDIRRQGDLVLDQQSLAVRKQRLIMLANLAGLTLVGSVALTFLRREVLGRRAREQAERRVDFLAYYDPLTKLPNRVQFQDQLQSLLNDVEPVATIFIDLDDFKLVNDTYGHAAGDAVLVRVAEILGRLAGEHSGIAARLSGDEFAMVLAINDIVLLRGLCKRIISEAGQQFSFDGEMLKAGLCIGLATSTQLGEQMAVSPELLSRVTDFALYASKSKGRNEFTVYNRDLEKQFLERRAMVDELPKAIESGELVVHLQPKVNLSGRTVYGFEALVRWNRNGHITPPADFILIAEESGSVVDIDRFVLREATKCIAVWNCNHGSDFSISVNLSAMHFSSRRIIDWVRDALSRSGLPPHQLTLEITETLELRNWDLARPIIHELHELGCKIAIDDFGTGFSSLAYLRATKADELKIDRSLVHEIEESEEARLLLSSVFEIAHNLNLEVTVEGIETEAQSIILQKMGAPHGQGYLFGRPRPPDEALNAAFVLTDQIARSGAA